MPENFMHAVDELKKKLLAMGALAETMIQKAIALQVDRDVKLVDEILRDEEDMNVFHKEIDDTTIQLIAIHTPVASDLRFLLMATRINSELERIGDQAENIGDHFKILEGKEPFKSSMGLRQMGKLAQEMLHKALDAFIQDSSEKAIEVIKSDDQVDDLNERVFRVLLTHMLDNPQNISRSLALILTARSFERIADCSVNIAENVIYMVDGKDLRHAKGI